MESKSTFEFGRFLLVGGEHKLLLDGNEVRIQPRAFDVLVLLVYNSPHLVKRSEFLKKVWADVNVERQCLDTCISDLRRILRLAGGEDYIETVPKNGFRFADVVKRACSGYDSGHCVGRERLLTHVHDQLQRHGCVTLFGLSGVGTTRLALEFADRYSADYCKVYRVSAAKPAIGAVDAPGAAPGGPRVGLTIDAGYRNLAVQIGLSSESLDGEHVRRSVLEHLNSHPGWLLLLDDVTTPDEIEPYLPHSSAGHVLITSNFPDWKHSIEVLPLEPAAAATFMETTTGQHDRPTALMLSKELGCLPRALVQAAAFVRLSNCSLRDYLNMLRREVQVLGTNEARESPVLVSLELLLKRIRVCSPAGDALMNLTAFFAPERIPDLAFRHWTTFLPEPIGTNTVTGDLLFRNALAQLRGSSLVSFEPKGFSVNRLVQRLAQHALGGHRSKWLQAALFLIHSEFPAHSGDSWTWDACSALLPHALTIAGHATIHQIEGPQIEPQGLTLHGDLWKRITDYLVERGAPLTVHAEMDQAISLLESVSGTDSADLVGPLNRLANVLHGTYERTGNKQHLEKAGEYQRRAVQIGSSQEYRDLYTKTDDAT